MLCGINADQQNRDLDRPNRHHHRRRQGHRRRRPEAGKDNR